MSTCKRAATNDCLLYGHNDGRGLLQGDGLSGWLVFTLPELKEGLVFIKAFVSELCIMFTFSIFFQNICCVKLCIRFFPASTDI